MDKKVYIKNMEMRLNPIYRLEQFLTKEGYYVEKFDVETVGEYSKHDALWNYKDTTHLDYVHSQADSCQSTLGDDIVTALHTQKIFGLKFPMCLIEYHRGDELNYYSTIFLFTLLVRTRFEDYNNTGSKTKTTYTVACPRWCRIFIPFLKYTVIKNYKILMSEDIPMRERKLYLRNKGYKFKHDNTRISWLKTASINEDYLILPDETSKPRDKLCINLNDVTEGKNLYGDSDHFGVIIIKNSNLLSIYNRICHHEGACLDEAKEDKNYLSCPWHGKKISPLKEFNLSEENFYIDAGGRTITRAENILLIEPKI
jgi:hypothetical protein